MLFGDDVVEMKWPEWEIALMKTAVLATLRSALADNLPEARRVQAAGWLDKYRRALACSRATKSPTSTKS